ncbi:MAG: hypothetical protein R3F56_13165 [Planctomycetota bacterium]
MTSEPILRLAGAAAGGGIGYLAFRALEDQGFLAVAVVGAGVALGGGLLARSRRIGWGVFVAILAVVATAVVEWKHSFRADESFASFVTNVGSLSTRSKLSYLAVALAGLWFGAGRPRRASRPVASV